MSLFGHPTRSGHNNPVGAPSQSNSFVAKSYPIASVRSGFWTGPAVTSVDVQVLGTPLFMSPEQALGGRELDERSDIYSLGTVAYFLLTGSPPFKREGGIEIMIAHARDPVVPPSRLRPEIPNDLERVVLRCLSKIPADRYQDAVSLERSLGECACASEWDQARAAHWWRDSAINK
jgi:serine/threonine-protein kinase